MNFKQHMTLSELQIQNATWTAHNFPNKQPEDPLLGVVEEVGELAHAHLKMKQGIRGTPEEHHAAKVDAIGDIMIYLSDYCNQNKIDLEEAVVTAWKEVRARDWQRYPHNGLTQ